MSNATYVYSYSDSQGHVMSRRSPNIQNVHDFLETHVEEDRLEGYAGQDATWHGTTEEGINWTVSVSSVDAITNDTNELTAMIMTPLEKMIRSSHYGLTDEQVAEAMVGTGKTFDVNSRYPAELIEGNEDDAFDGHMVITDMTWADYADIKRLDYLFVNLAIQEYAELYHKLASEHTEDAIVYQLNQYNSGITW